jgi:enediyne polyketide synthase
LVAQGAYRCEARIQTKEEDVWFDSEPLLGSPAVNDATVHALQACIPHRRLLPVRCERVSFAPRTDAELHLRAVERHAAGGEYVWDVVAQDANGARVVTWHGLTLADAGSLPHAESWPLPLLAAYLERAVDTLGLADRPHISVGHTSGLVLTVDEPLVCHTEAVTGRNREEWQHLLGDLTVLADQLEVRCPEPFDIRATRVWTSAACLSKIDSNGSLVLHGVYDNGWVLLRSGTALIASTVLPVGDADEPVAIAILSQRTEESS